MGWTARLQFVAGVVIFHLATRSTTALKHIQLLSQWVMVMVQGPVEAHPLFICSFINSGYQHKMARVQLTPDLSLVPRLRMYEALFISVSCLYMGGKGELCLT
jgi:hypothetical protein